MLIIQSQFNLESTWKEFEQIMRQLSKLILQYCIKYSEFTISCKKSRMQLSFAQKSLKYARNFSFCTQITLFARLADMKRFSGSGSYLYIHCGSGSGFYILSYGGRTKYSARPYRRCYLSKNENL
jgi:hypothetical protein